MRDCPNCRKRFTPRRIDQNFCCAGCSREDDARGLARCRRIYKAIYRLFSKRKYPERAQDFTFIYREVRSWIVEDQLRQRLGTPGHNHMADRGHQRERTRRAA